MREKLIQYLFLKCICWSLHTYAKPFFFFLNAQSSQSTPPDMERRLPWQQITSGTALRCQGSNRLTQQQPKWPRCKPAGLFPVLTPAKVFGWQSALWHIMKNKEAILSSSWSTIYIKDFHTVSAVQHPKRERLPFTDAQTEQCGSHTHTHTHTLFASSESSATQQAVEM